MKRYRGFKITYKPCTDHKPSRIMIKDLHERHRRILDYGGDDMSQQAKRFLEKLGIEIEGEVEVGDSIILLTENFKDSIQR